MAGQRALCVVPDRRVDRRPRQAAQRGAQTLHGLVHHGDQLVVRKLREPRLLGVEICQRSWWQGAAEHRSLGIPLRRDMGKNLAERAGPSIGRQTSLSVGAGWSPLFLRVNAVPFWVHQPAVLLSWPGEWITTRSGPLLHPAQISEAEKPETTTHTVPPWVKIRFVVRRLPRCCTGAGPAWGSAGGGAALRQVGAVLRHALVGNGCGPSSPAERMERERPREGLDCVALTSGSQRDSESHESTEHAPRPLSRWVHDFVRTWPSPGRSPSHPHPGMCAPLTAVSALHQP